MRGDVSVGHGLVVDLAGVELHNAIVLGGDALGGFDNHAISALAAFSQRCHGVFGELHGRSGTADTAVAREGGGGGTGVESLHWEGVRVRVLVVDKRRAGQRDVGEGVVVGHVGDARVDGLWDGRVGARGGGSVLHALWCGRRRARVVRWERRDLGGVRSHGDGL